MTFLADEAVDRQIVERLRLDGHQVAYVAEMSANLSSGSGMHRPAFYLSVCGVWDQL